MHINSYSSSSMYFTVFGWIVHSFLSLSCISPFEILIFRDFGMRVQNILTSPSSELYPCCCRCCLFLLMVLEDGLCVLSVVFLGWGLV